MASGYYDITNKTLGKGHFGVVKLGRHCLTGEPVAIKIIEKFRLNNDSLNQLGTEIRILFRLSEYEHPNILKLYQTIDSEDKLFLVTEYCGLHACDLHDYLSRKHRREGLSQREAQGFFIQICSAISYCHSMGIVHRDLKPENVLVTDYMYNSSATDKASPLLKLIDFGFANQWYPDEKMRTSCGTLAYSAPELLLGEPYDGTKVDVWGLGLMLYILLYGGNPFMQINDNETLTKILDCSFSTPIRDNVDIDAVELLRSLINRNPDSRLSIEAMLRHKWFSNITMPFELALKNQNKVDHPPPHPLKQLNKLAPVVSSTLPSISESGPLKNLDRSVDDNQVKTVTLNDNFSETLSPHHNRTRSLSITRIHPKPIQQQSLPQTKSSINLERLNHTAVSTPLQVHRSPQQHRGLSPIYRPTSPDVSGSSAPLSEEELKIHERVIQEMSKLMKLIDAKSSVEASLKSASFAHRLFNQNSIQPARTKVKPEASGMVKSLIQSRGEQARRDLANSNDPTPETREDKLGAINIKLCNDDYIYATYQLTRDRILRVEQEKTTVNAVGNDRNQEAKGDGAASLEASKETLLNQTVENARAGVSDLEDLTSAKENENCPRAQRKHLQPQHKMRDRFTPFFQSSSTDPNESAVLTGEGAQNTGNRDETGGGDEQAMPISNLASSGTMPEIQHEAFNDHNSETSGSTSRYFTSRTDLLQNSTAYALPLARKCSLVSEESGGSNELSDN